MTKSAKVAFSIVTPSLPNFVAVRVPGMHADLPRVDVADLTVEQIRALGAAWTQALFEHADRRRALASKERTTAPFTDGGDR